MTFEILPLVHRPVPSSLLVVRTSGGRSPWLLVPLAAPLSREALDQCALVCLVPSQSGGAARVAGHRRGQPVFELCAAALRDAALLFVIRPLHLPAHYCYRDPLAVQPPSRRSAAHTPVKAPIRRCGPPLLHHARARARRAAGGCMSSCSAGAAHAQQSMQAAHAVSQRRDQNQQTINRDFRFLWPEKRREIRHPLNLSFSQ